MAQHTIIRLTDDIDGSDAIETVHFTWNGTAYEIDLNEENLKGFRETMDYYAEHARSQGRSQAAGRPKGSGSKGSTRRDRQGPAEVRAWAAEQGIHVNERGRIPADVTAKYEAAHGGAPAPISSAPPATAVPEPPEVPEAPLAETEAPVEELAST